MTSNLRLFFGYIDREQNKNNKILSSLNTLDVTVGAFKSFHVRKDIVLSKIDIVFLISMDAALGKDFKEEVVLAFFISKYYLA